MDGELVTAPKKRRGRPRKIPLVVVEPTSMTTSALQQGGAIEMAPVSMSEDEISQRLNAADAAVAAARLAAEEAQQRSIEIRAEAALLVETVEDRAVEAVEAAQAEVRRLKAELKRVVGTDEFE